MNNQIKLMACLAAGSILLSGCVKYGEDELFPQEYHKVLNFKNGGERITTIYTTGEDETVNFTVMKTGSEETFSAKGKVALMTSAEYAAYAATNYLNYDYLPAGTYKFTDTELDFSDAESYKVLSVAFDAIAVKQQIADNGKQYVLPLKLTSPDASVKDSVLLLELDVQTPKAQFTKAGYWDAITFQPDGAAQQNISNSLTLGSLKNRWDFNCTIGVDDAAKQAFEAYNAEHEGKYVLLPEGTYTFTPTVGFTANADTAAVTVNVDRNKLQRGLYILPIHISDISKNGFEVNANASVMMAGIAYMPDRIPLTVDQFSSNALETYYADGIGYAGLIDGIVGAASAGKHFHSCYSDNTKHDPVYGQYIDVALKSPIRSIMFEYWTRAENGNAAPVEIDLYGSSDGKTWNKLGTANKGLPRTGVTKFTSKIYQSETAFSYFRFAVVTSANGDLKGQSWNCFNLAELSLYGN